MKQDTHELIVNYNPKTGEGKQELKEALIGWFNEATEGNYSNDLNVDNDILNNFFEEIKFFENIDTFNINKANYLTSLLLEIGREDNIIPFRTLSYIYSRLSLLIQFNITNTLTEELLANVLAEENSCLTIDLMDVLKPTFIKDNEELEKKIRKKCLNRFNDLVNFVDNTHDYEKESIEKKAIQLKKRLEERKKELEAEQQAVETVETEVIDIEKPKEIYVEGLKKNPLLEEPIKEILLPKEKILSMSEGIGNPNTNLSKNIKEYGISKVDYRNKLEKKDNNKEAYGILFLSYEKTLEEYKVSMTAMEWYILIIGANYMHNGYSKVPINRYCNDIWNNNENKQVPQNRRNELKEKLEKLNAIHTKYTNENEVKAHKNAPYFAYEGNLIDTFITVEMYKGNLTEFVNFRPTSLENRFYNEAPLFLLSLKRKQMIKIPFHIFKNPYNLIPNKQKNLSNRSIIISNYLIERIKISEKDKKKKEYKNTILISTILEKAGITKEGYSRITDYKKACTNEKENIINLLAGYQKAGFFKKYKISDDKILINY